MKKPANAASAVVRVRVHLKPRKLAAESGNGLWQHGRASLNVLRNAHLFRVEHDTTNKSPMPEFQAGVILTGRVPRSRLEILRRDPSVDRVEVLDEYSGPVWTTYVPVYWLHVCAAMVLASILIDWYSPRIIITARTLVVIGCGAVVGVISRLRARRR